MYVHGMQTCVCKCVERYREGRRERAVSSHLVMTRTFCHLAGERLSSRVSRQPPYIYIYRERYIYIYIHIYIYMYGYVFTNGLQPGRCKDNYSN